MVPMTQGVPMGKRGTFGRASARQRLHFPKRAAAGAFGARAMHVSMLGGASLFWSPSSQCARLAAAKRLKSSSARVAQPRVSVAHAESCILHRSSRNGCFLRVSRVRVRRMVGATTLLGKLFGVRGTVSSR